MLLIYRAIALLAIAVLLLGCGEKPQNMLVGSTAIKLVKPAGYCDSTNLIDLSAKLQNVGIFRSKKTLRIFEPCNKTNNFFAVVASDSSEKTYSNTTESYAASMSKMYEKLIRNGDMPIPQQVRPFLDQDKNAAYLALMQTEEIANKPPHDFSTVETGITMIKGKVLLFYIVKYSEHSIEVDKFTDLKAWIQEVHQVN